MTVDQAVPDAVDVLRPAARHRQQGSARHIGRNLDFMVKNDNNRYHFGRHKIGMRCFRSHGVETTRVLISGTRRGLTPKLVADLRRRSAIEPEIGHIKTDGRLSRCPSKGTSGDALFAALCACGHSIRKILAHPGLACLDHRRHSECSLPPGPPVSGCHIGRNALFNVNSVWFH